MRNYKKIYENIFITGTVTDIQNTEKNNILSNKVQKNKKQWYYTVSDFCIPQEHYQELYSLLQEHCDFKADYRLKKSEMPQKQDDVIIKIRKHSAGVTKEDIKNAKIVEVI